MSTRITMKHLLKREENLQKWFPEFRLSWAYGMVKAVRREPSTAEHNLSGFMSNREMDYWLDGFWRAIDMVNQKFVIIEEKE